MIEHIALIPAKNISTRCADKNWRPFVLDMNLVSYLISILPEGFFDKVILSTDKTDLEPIDKVIIHNRDKSLASKEAPVNDLIIEIINKYDIKKSTYLWLLNPTSPIRKKEDFNKIKEMVTKEHYKSVISASEINPFIWKDLEPLFDINYPRKNTQNFKIKYCVENGQFIVFNVDNFLEKKTWYGEKIFLYRQKMVHSFIDIDTDEDFHEAQRIVEINDDKETIKNETLFIEHIIREPVKEHTKLLFNHFSRYDFAVRKLNITKEDVVIDASCGKGYGSFLLSEKAGVVYGLDINEVYLKAASEMFNSENCNFIKYMQFYDMCGSKKINKVDKIVCIETFEHIIKEDIEDYISKLFFCLKTGGDMFLTVPLGNNAPSSYNEFHLNEPSIDYVFDLFESKFVKIHLEIENFINSFGYNVKYCVVILRCKKEAIDEI